MTQDINNKIHWICEENKMFIRKIDNFNMGEEIWLGVFIDGKEDTIENYIETDSINKKD